MSNAFTTTGLDGVEPGVTTTEFWIAVTTEGLTLADVFGFHHFTQAQDAAVLLAVPLAYMLVRSAVKAVAQLRTPAPAPVLPAAAPTVLAAQP